jgi:hypothetical protein
MWWVPEGVYELLDLLREVGWCVVCRLGAGVSWHVCDYGGYGGLRQFFVSLRRAHGRGCVLRFQGLHELCGVWAVGVFCGVVAKDVCV